LNFQIAENNFKIKIKPNTKERFPMKYKKTITKL